MIRAMRLMTSTVALAIALPLTAQESYTVAGNDIAIYNLAGEVTVTGASGRAVTVEVRRGGSDGGELDVEVGELNDRQTLRVLYPSDRISYDAGRQGGSTTLRVRSDGTWGHDDGSWFGRGDRVRISSRRGGLEAHADLHVGVPEGQRVAIHLAVGVITASNVSGDILLDTHAGGVGARDMTGRLMVDTGSGAVEVIGMDGDLGIDTGSGRVRVANVTGDDLGIDTGSGSVEADGVAARRILIDTGSGSVTLRRASAPDVRLDTGSGSVEAELADRIDHLVVDTGSGSVTLRLSGELDATLAIETGSGGIDVDFPIMVTHRSRDELHGTVGNGNGRIIIDTGSGGVRIRTR